MPGRTNRLRRSGGCSFFARFGGIMKDRMSSRITCRFVWVFMLIAVLLPSAHTQSQSQPFTEDQLETVCRNIKILGEDSIVDMVEKRGVDFHVTEAFKRRITKLGAGDALLKAVTKASEEHAKAESKEPAIGSKAARQALVAQAQEKTIPMPPPLDDKGKVELLEKARERAMEYTKSLPAFICLQVTQRYGNLQGQEKQSKLDEINAKLSFNEEHHEDYKVISVNGRMVDEKHSSMMEVGGAISTGEFGSLLTSVFDPLVHAKFEWLRQANLRGHATEVYGYTVRKEMSQWHLTYEQSKTQKLTTIPAFRGLVFVDRETAEVLRLSMSAVEIEKDFPIKSADDTLDYDRATISGYSFLLPQHAKMQLSDGTAVMDNDITFRLYRKFTTDSSITFDISDEAKDTPPKDPKDTPPPSPPVKKP